MQCPSISIFSEEQDGCSSPLFEGDCGDCFDLEKTNRFVRKFAEETKKMINASFNSSNENPTTKMFIAELKKKWIEKFDETTKKYEEKQESRVFKKLLSWSQFIYDLSFGIVLRSTKDQYVKEYLEPWRSIGAFILEQIGKVVDKIAEIETRRCRAR